MWIFLLKKSMKLLIIFAIACSVLAKKFDTDNNLAIDLAAKL